MNNKKRLIILVLFLFIFLLVLYKFLIMPAYADEIEKRTVTYWESLKNVIENSNSLELEVKLSDNISNLWEANQEITIPSNHKVTIIANSSITIKRTTDYLGCFIVNNGELIIKTSSKDYTISFNGNNIEANGSIITFNNGKIELENVIIQNNNKKNGNGGGIVVVESATEPQLICTNVKFQENKGNNGGAICVLSETCETKLNNVSIISNTATSQSGGGGIYDKGSMEIIGSNTKFKNNTAQTYGGAIRVKNKCTIQDGLFSSNKALENNGGAIKVDGNLIMNGGTITNNTAKVNGGGIDFDTGWFEYNAGIVENNTTDNNDDNSNTFPPLTKYKDWTKDENLNLKNIKAKLLKSFTKGTQVEECASQGIAIGKDYVVWAQVKSVDENTYIYIADKSLNIKKINNEHNFGHANTMTYNTREDRYYISYTSQNKCYISSFKVDSNQNINSIQTKEISRYYLGFAYINQNNQDYYIGVYRNEAHIMDNNFNVINRFSTNTDLTKQDVAYYDNHIYYACYESGHITSYQKDFFNSKEKHSNLIYVYNLDGVLEKTLYIPYKLIDGEIEGIYIDDNNFNFYYNRTNKISFYQITNDVFDPKLDIHYSTTEVTNENVTVTITADEEVQEVEGWTLSSDKKILTKSYSANANETITVYDLAGNKKTINVKIENISTIKIGDLNENDKIDIGDILLIYRHIAQKNSAETAQKHPEWKLSDQKVLQGDLNNNNQLDIGDCLRIQRYISASNSATVASKHPDWLEL